jgi:type IV fimbrial biogenesis protein FimT
VWVQNEVGAKFKERIAVTMIQKPGLKEAGLTLIELIVVVVIVAIMALVAMPSYTNWINREQVKNAAEDVYALLTEAKAESVMRDANIAVRSNSDQWCVGFTTKANCDCTETDSTAAGACTVLVGITPVLKVLDGSVFDNVTAASVHNTTFNAVRGTAGAGSFQLTSGTASKTVSISNYGRIRVQ